MNLQYSYEAADLCVPTETCQVGFITAMSFIVHNHVCSDCYSIKSCHGVWQEAVRSDILRPACPTGGERGGLFDVMLRVEFDSGDIHLISES